MLMIANAVLYIIINSTVTITLTAKKTKNINQFVAQHIVEQMQHFLVQNITLTVTPQLTDSSQYSVIAVLWTFPLSNKCVKRFWSPQN